MKILGLSPLEIEILKLIAGSPGNQDYGTIGFMCSSLYKFRLTEAVYRPRFLKLCAKGLLEWRNPEERFLHFKHRTFRLSQRGQEFIRDLQIFYGGDYSFYRYFSGNASDLDRFLPHKVKFEARGAQHDQQQKSLVDARSRRIIERQRRKIMVDFGASSI